MARRRNSNPEPATAARAEIVLTPQVTSGPVGVFPVPKPDPLPPAPEPPKPAKSRAVFEANGKFLAKIGGRTVLLVSRGRKIYAEGQEQIAWCRDRGFPEVA